MEFRPIFSFLNITAKKLENSSYLEELTGLLAKASGCLDDEKNYYFDKNAYLDVHSKEPNSKFKEFNSEFTSSFLYGNSNRIYIIRGRAGVGKTLFFKEGVLRLTRKNGKFREPYIHLGVDFRNIDNDKDIQYYIELIYRQLFDRAVDCIREIDADSYINFIVEYEKDWERIKTTNSYLFPVKFFCERIFEKYGRPCVIVFDNIDLASVKTQKHVFQATVNVCQHFSDFMNRSKYKNCYRVYFAMRPETYLQSEEAKLGEVINFPLPNVLNIFLRSMKNALILTARDLDKSGELVCSVTCNNVIENEEDMIALNTFSDVADYFCRILDTYLGKAWNENEMVRERFGRCEEFHCDLVNYNVRTFIQFLADTICNGGFKPLTKEFNHDGVTGYYYNVFDYVEMIIRGRWVIHPGNKYMDGEGGNKSPIVYNVFDTNLYGNNQSGKIKHFMLNIRILQYFALFADGRESSYGELVDCLREYFSDVYILSAVKKLVYVRLLYSFSQGDRTIASLSDWRKVEIDKSTKLELSPSGRFYLEKLICEFEYLYQMSLSSLMRKEYVEELASKWKQEKEYTVLCFLRSIFEIIQINIEEYRQEGTLMMFISQFYNIEEGANTRPYRRMIRSFIAVMNNKVQRAKKKETGSLSKLNNILEEACRLEVNVNNYFTTLLK